MEKPKHLNVNQKFKNTVYIVLSYIIEFIKTELGIKIKRRK